MFARVPASSANLGPGFDTLAVALALYVEVTVEPADAFSISSEGCGAGLFDDERHLGARVAARVLGHSSFSMHVNSEIPLSRGLGSSAALAVAAAVVAGRDRTRWRSARDVDGHAENAAASLLGGLVVAGIQRARRLVARPLALDDAWRFVVVIPDEELATADARRVLPGEVAFADAVRNLNSFGLLASPDSPITRRSSRRLDGRLSAPAVSNGAAALRQAAARDAAREWRVGFVLVGRGLDDARAGHERTSADDVAQRCATFLDDQASPGRTGPRGRPHAAW